MADVTLAPCSKCGGEVENQTAMREFEREDVRVEVSAIHVLMCQQCGEIYFAPGGAQAVVEAANGLFELTLKKAIAV